VLFTGCCDVFPTVAAVALKVIKELQSRVAEAAMILFDKLKVFINLTPLFINLILLVIIKT
jgi:hypothetical protein